MKNIALFILATLLSFCLNAQKIQFTDSTNKWYYYHEYDSVQSRSGVQTGHDIHKYEYSDSIIRFNNRDYMLLKNKEDKWWYYSGDWLIRTDSSGKKIYAKHRGKFKDEHLLYDFSLKTGDTLTLDSNEFTLAVMRYVVTVIDSVQVDGQWYKIFRMNGIDLPPAYTYCVIENIGCMTDLFTPFNLNINYMFNGFGLKCFINNNVNPVFSKSFTYFWYIFDNNKSCADTILPAKRYSSQTTNPYSYPQPVENTISAHTVYPQPAGTFVKIALPDSVDGEVSIANIMGKQVYNTSFNKQLEIEILNNGIFQPGVYTYKVQDNTNSRVYIGKIIFQ